MSTPIAAPTAALRVGQIAVVGKPNVGKSTLLNRLVGEKVSITSRKAQTTRLPLRGILTTDTAQFVFVDTPGFQTKHGGEMNKRLNGSVRRTLGEVDVVLWVWDATRLSVADRAVLELIPAKARVIAVPNKVDLLLDKSSLGAQVTELSALREFAALCPSRRPKAHKRMHCSLKLKSCFRSASRCMRLMTSPTSRNAT